MTNYIHVECSCDITMPCPQGKKGNSPRCIIWLRWESARDLMKEDITIYEGSEIAEEFGCRK